MVEALSRLSLMVRGVGNPLVAAYTRCYLCRVSVHMLLHLIQLYVYNNSMPYAYTYVQKMYRRLFICILEMISCLMHANKLSFAISVYDRIIKK